MTGIGTGDSIDLGCGFSVGHAGGAARGRMELFHWVGGWRGVRCTGRWGGTRVDIGISEGCDGMQSGVDDGERQHAGNSKANIAPFVCGGVAGLINDSLLHPVDTVRARLQVAGARRMAAGPLAAFGQMSRTIIRESVASSAPAWSGFYRGISSVALLCPLAYGTYFGTYTLCMRAAEDHYGGERNVPTYVHFFGGLLAELASNAFYVPYDVTKQHLQVGTGIGGRGGASHVLGVAGGLLQKQGLGGLYRGVGATLITYMPFSGIYFCTYETIKRESTLVDSSADFFFDFCAAATAGAAAAAATQPMDVVKTRIQVGQGGGSWAKTLRLAIKEEGTASIVRGTAARVLTHAPACGLTMAIFEGLLKHSST